MTLVGLTGGIGSGKTTVANLFAEKGIPVYITDDAAKRISETPEVVKRIADEFSKEDIFEDGIISRLKLGNIVFRDKSKLERLNSIIHPLVQMDFEQWLIEKSFHPLLVKESAILFETGGYLLCDKVITVIIPLKDQIERVMNRNNMTQVEVLIRINNQISNDERKRLSDFVIINTDLEETKSQVNGIIKKLGF